MPGHQPAGDADPTTAVEVPQVREWTAIGPYRLIRKLGEGGMGVVFHAQEPEPIRRDVALKVIKPGMNSDQVVARFESERQALALMDHTNIARVYNAGTTADGLPYFVMELVDGLSITRYCDAKKLPIRSRVAIFIEVCQAVQHAHQKGIIHRDIKPSNILVKEQEGRAVPKVIDFGLAMALGAQVTDATAMTSLGTVLGTFQYMSPEQADLNRRDIDTRSDIYSLGVVLYELLTGVTSLGRELDNVGILEVLRRIREDDAVPPSQCVRAARDLSIVADLRHSDPYRLPKELDHELDWIVMKALEKERAERYETVSGLVRDLQRYLAGDTVDAAPHSAVYRLRKLVRRHRVGLATAAAFALLLITAAAVSAWLAVRASRAERDARAVTEFLRNDVLAQASADNQAGPTTSPNQTLTVRMALDRAASRIGDGRFTDAPLVEASVRQTIGDTYVDLGAYLEGQQHIEAALAIRRRLLGERHADTQTSTRRLAFTLEQRGQFAPAEALLTTLAGVLDQTRGESHLDTIAVTAELGRIYWQQGQYVRAEPMLGRALDGQRRALGPDDPATLATTTYLAHVLYSQGKYADAEPLYVAVLDGRRRTLGPEHPLTAISMNNLAGLHRAVGRHRDAEDLYMTAWDVRVRALGAEHPDTLASVYNLAALYEERGRLAEAEPLFQQVLSARRRILGEDHPRTLGTKYAMADLLSTSAQHAQAETLFADVLAARQRTLGKTHPDTLSTHLFLGRTQLDQRKFADAQRSMQALLQLQEGAGLQGWVHGAALSLLGESLAGQGRHADAEARMLAGHRELLEHRGTMAADDETWLHGSTEALQRLYLAWGRPDEAQRWASQ